jgi:hypothetical protein
MGWGARSARERFGGGGGGGGRGRGRGWGGASCRDGPGFWGRARRCRRRRALQNATHTKARLLATRLRTRGSPPSPPAPVRVARVVERRRRQYHDGRVDDQRKRKGQRRVEGAVQDGDAAAGARALVRARLDDGAARVGEGGEVARRGAKGVVREEGPGWRGRGAGIRARRGRGATSKRRAAAREQGPAGAPARPLRRAAPGWAGPGPRCSAARLCRYRLCGMTVAPRMPMAMVSIEGSVKIWPVGTKPANTSRHTGRAIASSYMKLRALGAGVLVGRGGALGGSGGGGR